MTLRPLQDRVLIRRVEPEAKTPRPVFSSPTRPRKSRWKAKSSRSAPVRGTRMASCHPLDVKSGDRVLFGKWSGTEVKIDGEDLMIMKDADIMGVIDRAAVEQKAA